MARLILSLEDDVYEFLRSEAKARGINVQTLLRAIIIPDWAKAENPRQTQQHPFLPSASFHPGEYKRHTVAYRSTAR